MARVDLADRLSDARARVAAETPPGKGPVPMFAQLTRKDARIRDDQATALSTLADAVMRRRRFKAERITENTLIRVAIDLLLAHADRLSGSTEDELRNSVTSALPNSAAPLLPDSGPSGRGAAVASTAVTGGGAGVLTGGPPAPADFGRSEVPDFGSSGPAVLARTEDSA